MSTAKKQTATIQHDLDVSTPKWFAVYTKYKCEKYVAEVLGKKQIQSYVPLLHVTKQYASKKKEYYIPLINCYAFVKITKDEYLSVLQTEYVMSFVKNGPHLISIPDHEIEILQRIVGEKQDVELNPLSVNIGQRVEIIHGNLTGIEGIIVDKKGKKELVIELQNMAYEMRININPSFLQAKV